MDDITLRAVGADDLPSLRELAFARVLALDDAACTVSCARSAREHGEAFELCVRSIGSDPALTDVYERLLPALERVRRRLDPAP